jgi:hypothetical protein
MIRDAVRAEDYAAFDYSGVVTRDGVQGWGSTSVEARKHHVYTGLTNSIGILLETPSNTHRVMRDGTVRAIPEEERYFHQIRGGVLAMRAILRAASEQREAIRAVTTGARNRAISAGATAGDPVVLEYALQSRGTEPVWMPEPRRPPALHAARGAGVPALGAHAHHDAPRRLSPAPGHGGRRAPAAGPRSPSSRGGVYRFRSRS